MSIMQSDEYHDEFFKDWNKSEVAIYKRLGSHPRIVPVLNTDDMLVLQNQTNGSLMDYLIDHPDVPFDLQLRWIVQLAEGILHLHSKNVVWSDCKPQNILVTDSLDIVLCDFDGSIMDGWPPTDIRPPMFYILPSYFDNWDGLFPPNQDRYAFGTCVFLLLARRWPMFPYRIEDSPTYEEMAQAEQRLRRGEFDALSKEAFPEMAGVVQKCWRDMYGSTEDMLHDVRECCIAALERYEMMSVEERTRLYGYQSLQLPLRVLEKKTENTITRGTRRHILLASTVLTAIVVLGVFTFRYRVFYKNYL